MFLNISFNIHMKTVGLKLEVFEYFKVFQERKDMSIKKACLRVCGKER